MCKRLFDLQIPLHLVLEKKKWGEVEKINKTHFQLSSEALATFL